MYDGGLEAIDDAIDGHGLFHLIILRFQGEDLPKMESLAKTNAMVVLSKQ